MCVCVCECEYVRTSSCASLSYDRSGSKKPKERQKIGFLEVCGGSGYLYMYIRGRVCVRVNDKGSLGVSYTAGVASCFRSDFFTFDHHELTERRRMWCE